MPTNLIPHFIVGTCAAGVSFALYFRLTKQHFTILKPNRAAVIPIHDGHDSDNRPTRAAA